MMFHVCWSGEPLYPVWVIVGGAKEAKLIR